MDVIFFCRNCYALPPRLASPDTPPKKGNFSLRVQIIPIQKKGIFHCACKSFPFPSFGGVPVRAGWFLYHQYILFFSRYLRGCIVTNSAPLQKILRYNLRQNSRQCPLIRLRRHLRHNTLRAHARNGIDFQHIQLMIIQHIINPANAIQAQ